VQLIHDHLCQLNVEKWRVNAAKMFLTGFVGKVPLFRLQSGIYYNIETGKQTNSNEEHGVAYSNGSKITYHIKSTQLYNCNRGGRRQLKVEVSNCLKK